MGMVAKTLRLAAAVALSLPLAHGQTPTRGAIEGDVVDASTGRGIAGARVRIQSGQDDALFTTSDEQGHFRFAEVDFMSKGYQAEASYPGFISARRAAGRSGGETVSPSPYNPSVQIRLEMVRYGVIVGRVTDPVGVAVEGVTVAALERYAAGERGHGSCGLGSTDGDYQYLGRFCARTNDLGEYRIGPLTAGSYYVGVDPQLSPGQPATRMPRDPTERATFYPHALKPSEAMPVTVTEGKELRADVQIVRQGGVKVSGRVFGLGAGEAAGLQISVYAVPLSSSTTPWSDLDIRGDHFQAPDLLPGKYLFEAFQYSLRNSPNENTVVAATRRTVEVRMSDLDGVDLTLTPTLDIEGSVVFENGCAAAPAWIQLQGDFLQELHVGTEGRFVLRHLIPGKYKVYVHLEIPSNAYASSATLGDTEILTDGFEATSNTRGPLRITMSCGRR